MKNQRSLLVFEQAMKTEATSKAYLFQLDKFRKYYRLKDYDSILTIEPKKLQIMVEDYLFYLKKRLSPSSVKQTFFPIELFLSMNDVTINFKKIRKMFPSIEKRVGDNAYTTKDIQNILKSEKSVRNRALVHVLASSGMRVGGITELLIKHLKDMPNGCRAVLVYAGSRDEYTTFLTSEASEALEEYFEERRRNGELFKPESPVFRMDKNKVGIGKAELLTFGAVANLMMRIVSRVRTTRKRQTNTRYTIQSSHGLRKRFNTILKSNNDVNPNLAEKMMGHSVTIQLDNTYLLPTVERLFEEYVKVIPELLIDESYKLKIENELKDKKIERLESDEERRISNLESKFEQITALLENVNTSH